jgi:hypothetical protein
MEKLLFFFTHYGIPTTFLSIALLRRPKSLLGLWAAAAFFSSAMLFLFVWGQWPLVGSYYGRLLPLAVLVVVILCAVRRTGAGLPVRNARFVATAGSTILVVLTAYVGLGVVRAFVGKNYSEPLADLEFPLKGGRYYVSSGGSSKVINNHMRDFPNAQEYALDINKLGPAGGASANILSSDNQLHHIFGEPVHAPEGVRGPTGHGRAAARAGRQLRLLAGAASAPPGGGLQRGGRTGRGPHASGRQDLLEERHCLSAIEVLRAPLPFLLPVQHRRQAGPRLLDRTCRGGRCTLGETGPSVSQTAARE